MDWTGTGFVSASEDTVIMSVWYRLSGHVCRKETAGILKSPEQRNAEKHRTECERRQITGMPEEHRAEIGRTDRNDGNKE